MGERQIPVLRLPTTEATVLAQDSVGQVATKTPQTAGHGIPPTPHNSKLANHPGQDQDTHHAEIRWPQWPADLGISGLDSLPSRGWFTARRPDQMQHSAPPSTQRHPLPAPAPPRGAGRTPHRARTSPCLPQEQHALLFHPGKTVRGHAPSGAGGSAGSSTVVNNRRLRPGPGSFPARASSTARRSASSSCASASVRCRPVWR